MKRAFAAALALAAAQVSAQGLYICTNEKGNKSYQDEPCTTKMPSPALAPVKADALNDRVVRETMKRYEEAMSTRDPIAVARLLSPSLKVDLKMIDGSKSGKYDYVKFTDTVRLVLNAYPSYRVKHKCKAGKAPSATVAVLDCVTEEEIKIQGKFMWGQANETFHFVVENGEVKIRELISVQLTEAQQR
ncbi:MAG: DUF4124 domain-containing protein [Burkholderiales bacterium]|nr:DUF4124 domain-containing protein [Burkholderiales bacterium]